MRYFITLLSVVSILVITLLAACGPDPTATPFRRPTTTPTPRPTPTPKGAPKIKQYPAPPRMTIDQEKTYVAVMDTNKGTMKLELFASEAPNTVNNFIFLSRDGYYDGVKFHRIIEDFMVQSGDPTGTGAGGPGYKFEDEPVTRDYVSGTIAMANSGTDTNGSQFFIVHSRTNLPKNYTIFGQVIEGMNVVDAIAKTPVGLSRSGEMSKPLQDVIIKTITIQESEG